MTTTKNDVRRSVQDHYAKVATEGVENVGCAPGCCSQPAPDASLVLGYTENDLESVPEDSNLGLGCGNPHALAMIQEGETVLDLGSGAGLDCFLAAKKVGPKGRVIGVDMTPDMIQKARENAKKAKVSTVEFRLGEIEHLPVEDESVDIILSNCVINLSPEKELVFQEAFRALRPGGRLSISDIVAIKEIPSDWEKKIFALVGCISGAADVKFLQKTLERVGFKEISIEVQSGSRDLINSWQPELQAGEYVASAIISAHKPKEEACCQPGCCES